MQDALIITGVGMGLVFVSIIFLWGLMELLVRFTTKKSKPDQSGPSDENESTQITEAGSEQSQKPSPAKIAALAVTVAQKLRLQMAADKAVKKALEQPVENIPQPVSSWQAVQRAVNFERRNQLFNRKPRGTV